MNKQLSTHKASRWKHQFIGNLGTEGLAKGDQREAISRNLNKIFQGKRKG
jgi:hypothetical protein